MRIPTPRRFWLLSFLYLVCLPLWLGSSSFYSAARAGVLCPSPTKSSLLRIAAPASDRQPAVISAYGPGFEQELAARFCKEADCTPQWISVADRQEGLDLLRAGKADVLVGFGGDIPAQDVAVAAPALAESKPYALFKPIRVHLAEPFVQAASDPIDRGHAPDDATLLLDPAAYALWLPYLGSARAELSKTNLSYRWFWREDGSDLSARLAEFWSEPGLDAALAELTERYFGFLPRTPRQQDALDLADAVTNRLPRYQEYILKASKETGVPPLFLVAVIYQESRFDPQATSETGVRGIMQLTSATARMLGVDRMNPEQCIMGGARYLRELWEQVGDKGRSDWDRWFMALAAYNQGMGTLNQAIRISRGMGDSGETWVELKKAYPLSTVGRGSEAKAFVEKVRYYHFVLQGLIALSPAETQHLAPLFTLSLAPATGFGASLGTS